MGVIITLNIFVKNGKLRKKQIHLMKKCKINTKNKVKWGRKDKYKNTNIEKKILQSLAEKI